MQRNLFFTLAALALAALACSAIMPAAQPTATPLPTATEIPATATPAPTTTPKPQPSATASEVIEPTATENTVDFLIPDGEPVEEWEGFPIMPGAIAGKGDSQGYTFTIKATPDEVKAFYQAELGKLDYELFASGGGEGDKMMILFFMKGSAMLTVSIIPHEDLLLVLLVK